MTIRELKKIKKGTILKGDKNFLKVIIGMDKYCSIYSIVVRNCEDYPTLQQLSSSYIKSGLSMDTLLNFGNYTIEGMLSDKLLLKLNIITKLMYGNTYDLSLYLELSDNLIEKASEIEYNTFYEIIKYNKDYVTDLDFDLSQKSHSNLETLYRLSNNRYIHYIRGNCSYKNLDELENMILVHSGWQKEYTL